MKSSLSAFTLILAFSLFTLDVTKAQDAAPKPTPSETYAREIGAARFERSAIKVQQGYTVESGNLYLNAETGSLVVVRAPDGAVIALIDAPDKRGLLKVDAQGASTFRAEPPTDYMAPDTVEATDQEFQANGETRKAGEHRYVDVLVAYSDYASRLLDTDLVAYALAQVETANLGLRNSLVTDLSLRLAAVNVFNVGYDTSSAGLKGWQTFLAPYRAMYSTDVNATYASSGDSGGRAYVGGYTSVNMWSVTAAFRHEIGHNAGGSHCNSGSASYKFGYNNGKSQTYLCGNKVPYYSVPEVNDAYGLPLGDSHTADMARTWRESAARLSGYNPGLPGLRLMLLSPVGEASRAEAHLSIPLGGTAGGVVALSADVGPTELVTNPTLAYTELNVKLLNEAGNPVNVKLRGHRRLGDCGSSDSLLFQMNASTGCGATTLDFWVTFEPDDNASLARGHYNGLLQLEARRPDSDWKTPINISVSVREDAD